MSRHRYQVPDTFWTRMKARWSRLVKRPHPF